MSFGEIPNDWDELLLKDMAQVIDGDRSSNYPSGDDIVKEGKLFLSTKNIIDSFFNFNEVRFITEEKFNSIKKGKLKKDDLVITMRGSIGSVARFSGEQFDTALINAQMSIIRPISVNSDYLWSALNSIIMPRYLKKITSGSAQPQLTKKDVEKIPVILPTLPEQKKIASILSIWDKAIELKEKLIEQKKEQKKGLMQKLLTGEVRLPGFDGEWESVPVEKLCSLIMGKTPSRNNDDYWGSGYKWISIADLKSKYILQTSEEITEKALKETKIKAIPKGTVIMSFKLTIGRVGITGEDMYSNEAIVSLRNKDKKILDDEYLYYYLSSIDVTKFGSIAAKGVTLNSDSLKEIIIKLPNISEQVAIREIMSKLDLNIELLEKELSLLKEQKNGLMQQLLTGKVRVKV